MPVELNHTIVSATDAESSARFMTEVLGLEAPTKFGSFMVVQTSNGVSLDFRTSSRQIAPQHYAFLITETEFDEILERIRGLGLDYWADPSHRQPGEINTRDNGRAVYFDDPDGHSLEILTRPYGSGG